MVWRLEARGQDAGRVVSLAASSRRLCGRLPPMCTHRSVSRFPLLIRRPITWDCELMRIIHGSLIITLILILTLKRSFNLINLF